MIHAQHDKVVAELPAGTTASSGTATLTIDCLGYEHASITVIRASNSATTFASVLKVEESDNDSSYSNVSALVMGGTGGFTLPAIGATATGTEAVVKMDVNCGGRKRYLKVSYTPSTAVNAAISARLSRAKNAPTTDGDAGCLDRIVV